MKRTFRGLAALAAVALAGQPGASARPLPAGTPDNPEPDKQGETMPDEDHVLPRAYSKGIDLIGHSTLDDRGGNLIMTWSGHCAYVADGMGIKPDGTLDVRPIGPKSGVAVIDVSDPAAPKVTRYLQDKGALNATETLHAVTTRGRAVLAASTYGGVAGINGPKDGWLSLYDVSRCAQPRLLAELKWPEPVHTLTVSPDGRFVYGTLLNPFTGTGGIQVMDISNPARPSFIGKFKATRADGGSFEFAPHELAFAPDGRTVYVGVLSSQGADAEREFRNPHPGVPSPAAVGRDAGGIFILDTREIADGKAEPRLRLIGSVAHAGWHSPARARIGGKPYLVNAGELGACPGAWPRITAISDPRKPAIVGEFRLAMNRPENCPTANAIEAATGGMVGRSGVASTHFQDVDDAANTRLGLFSFMAAGLRIADLRDPANPTELAYFKPGDPCMSHVRYLPASGQIWFACNASGFYVIRVKPAVRAAAGLPQPGKR